ncbi:MAG: hypothetical protein QG623_665 [Patescibacteria group bacterium]|nr:hypothetical protein [Patescibacteria group bacterium]
MTLISKTSMSITMCISCSQYMYNYLLVHTFYNSSVAKNVTTSNLKHIISTATPQHAPLSVPAVNLYREGSFTPTLYTPTTTTIFNRIVIRTKFPFNKLFPQTYTIKN